MIVLRPSNKCIASIILVFVLVLLATLLFLVQFGTAGACLLFFSTAAILIPNSIVIGRTLVLSQTGCKIKIGPYSKTYAWDAFHTIRIEGSHLGIRLPYHKGGMFFSVRPTKKPSWFDPILYSSLFHPISSFTVFFVNDETAVSTPGYYEFDKQMFLEQLDLWGVSYTNA